jgi:hypothetical protein
MTSNYLAAYNPPNCSLTWAVSDPNTYPLTLVVATLAGHAITASLEMRRQRTFCRWEWQVIRAPVTTVSEAQWMLFWFSNACENKPRQLQCMSIKRFSFGAKPRCSEAVSTGPFHQFCGDSLATFS